MEQGAFFGNGKDIKVGYYVGIGKNFKSLNRILTIEDELMMGDDVLFLGADTIMKAKTFQWVNKVINLQYLCTFVLTFGLVLVPLSYMVANTSAKASSSVQAQLLQRMFQTTP